MGDFYTVFGVDKRDFRLVPWNILASPAVAIPFSGNEPHDGIQFRAQRLKLDFTGISTSRFRLRACFGFWHTWKWPRVFATLQRNDVTVEDVFQNPADSDFSTSRWKQDAGGRSSC